MGDRQCRDLALLQGDPRRCWQLHLHRLQWAAGPDPSPRPTYCGRCDRGRVLGLGLGLAGPVGQQSAPRQPHCSILPACRRVLPLQFSSPSRWSPSARLYTRATRPCCDARPRETPSHSFSGRAKTASWTPPSWDLGRGCLPPTSTPPLLQPSLPRSW